MPSCTDFRNTSSGALFINVALSDPAQKLATRAALAPCHSHTLRLLGRKLVNFLSVLYSILVPDLLGLTVAV